MLRPGGLCKSYGEGGETTTVVSQGMVHFGSVLCGSVLCGSVFCGIGVVGPE